MAKSLGGGLPISGVVGRAAVMDAPHPGGLGGTYAANPLAVAAAHAVLDVIDEERLDRKSTRLNSSHLVISYAVFCLKKKTAYDVYPLDGRHDGGYYTVKDCVTIDVLPRTPGNNVYVGFMVWSNFTATKCRGLVSLNQVIKEIICLQPLK